MRVQEIRVPIREDMYEALATRVNNGNHRQRDRIIEHGATLAQLEKFNIYSMVDWNKLPYALTRFLVAYEAQK